MRQCGLAAPAALVVGSPPRPLPLCRLPAQLVPPAGRTQPQCWLRACGPREGRWQGQPDSLSEQDPGPGAWAGPPGWQDRLRLLLSGVLALTAVPVTLWLSCSVCWWRAIFTLSVSMAWGLLGHVPRKSVRRPGQSQGQMLPGTSTLQPPLLLDSVLPPRGHGWVYGEADYPQHTAGSGGRPAKGQSARSIHRAGEANASS